jgi:GNAT superfamily N-acetyltransferase
MAASSVEMTELVTRLATHDDVAAIVPLMRASIDELQARYLDAAQIASSRAVMGLDSRLIDDGTYYVVEADGMLAGCGGWSRRAAIVGTDDRPGAGAGARLHPARDAARIRAMYTHPRHARRGVGRLILSLAETAAAAEGFRQLELLATLAGQPLYRAAGYHAIERLEMPSDGVPVPVVRMRKAIAPRPPAALAA